MNLSTLYGPIMGGPRSNTKNIIKTIKIANITITMNMGFFLKKGIPLIPIMPIPLSCLLLPGGGYEFGPKVERVSVSTAGVDVKVVDAALDEDVDDGGVIEGVSVLTSSLNVFFKGSGISGNNSNGVSQ